MGDDGSVVTGGSGNATTVTSLLFQVRDDGTFRHLTDGHHVADTELGLLSAVNELTGVHAFGGNEQLFPGLIAVRVPEIACLKCHFRQVFF